LTCFIRDKESKSRFKLAHFVVSHFFLAGCEIFGLKCQST